MPAGHASQRLEDGTETVPGGQRVPEDKHPTAPTGEYWSVGHRIQGVGPVEDLYDPAGQASHLPGLP